MKMRTIIKSTLTALSLAVATQAVQAIEIYVLDASGNVIGGPVATSWNAYSGSPADGTSVTDISAGASTDWEVLVGLSDFGDPEGGSQTSAIYGAGTVVSGVYGVKVVFDFDGYTWDSYDEFGTYTPNPGAQTGYWDVFAVNINESGSHYWDVVTGDPIVSPDPAGTPVIDTGILPGVTWAWGGLDYAAGYFEEEHGIAIELISLSLTSTTFHISAVLDTRTNPYADSAYPSWGCFNSSDPDTCVRPEGGTSQDLPEPVSMVLLGIGLLGLGVASRRRA